MNGALTEIRACAEEAQAYFNHSVALSAVYLWRNEILSATAMVGVANKPGLVVFGRCDDQATEITVTVQSSNDPMLAAQTISKSGLIPNGWVLTSTGNVAPLAALNASVRSCMSYMGEVIASNGGGQDAMDFSITHDRIMRVLPKGMAQVVFARHWGSTPAFNVSFNQTTGVPFDAVLGPDGNVTLTAFDAATLQIGSTTNQPIMATAVVPPSTMTTNTFGGAVTGAPVPTPPVTTLDMPLATVVPDLACSRKECGHRLSSHLPSKSHREQGTCIMESCRCERWRNDCAECGETTFPWRLSHRTSCKLGLAQRHGVEKISQEREREATNRPMRALDLAEDF